MSENIEIKIARTKEEQNQAFYVRYKVFVEERKNFDLSEYAEQKERDEWDDLETTVNFLALYDKKPVGTVRMIVDSEKGLPLEKYLDLFSMRKGNKMPCEGGRYAVLKDYRSRRKIWVGLLKILLNYTRMKNFDHMYGLSSSNMKKLHQMVGWYPIGKEIFSSEFNDYIIPMRLELDKIREPFRKFFAEPWQEIEKPYHEYKNG